MKGLIFTLQPATVNVVHLSIVYSFEGERFTETMRCHDYQYDPRLQVLTLFAVVNGTMMEVCAITRVFSVTVADPDA